jgi:hypothetical protein
MKPRQPLRCTPPDQLKLDRLKLDRFDQDGN